MKFGYDTWTDFESVTVQFPIYVPAMQNAINNLWSFSESNLAPVRLSEGFKINPSSFSLTIIPIFGNSLASMEIRSVSFNLACFTFTISIGSEDINDKIASGGRRSGEFRKSKIPPVNFSGDLILISFSLIVISHLSWIFLIWFISLIFNLLLYFLKIIEDSMIPTKMMRKILRR